MLFVHLFLFWIKSKNKVNKFLNNQYPYYYNFKNALVLGMVILILSTVFSFLFEPFEVNFQELKYPYFIISLIHSLVSFIVFLILVLVLNGFRSKSDDWLVKYELLFLLILLIIIGVGQFLIRDVIYDKDDNWSFSYLVEEIRNTLLVGSLLLFIITSVNIERLKNIYNKRSRNLTHHLFVPHNEDETIKIITSVKSDDFDLTLSDFLYAKSDKNYTEIFLSDGKSLKRLTLKSLENQLSEFAFICKTHRSFLVNLNKIASIKGNTQGYKIVLKNHTEIVPVSRSMISKFEAQLNGLKS